MWCELEEVDESLRIQIQHGSALQVPCASVVFPTSPRRTTR
jgi:hypothetical protein